MLMTPTIFLDGLPHILPEFLPHLLVCLHIEELNILFFIINILCYIFNI